MTINMNAFRQGDSRQLELVFEFLYPTLCRYAGRLLPNSAAAEDIVMDSLLYLWKHRTKPQHKSDIKAFLCRNIRHRCQNHDKRLERCQNAHLEMVYLNCKAPVDPYHAFACSEELEEVMKAASTLPPRMAQIFHLAYMDELTTTEIARNMHISRKTVLCQRRKAVRMLLHKFRRPGRK